MRQDTMSATWRKERSTVDTNEIMKTAAHRSESWCWRQLHAVDTCSKTRHVPFLCVKTQTSVLKEQHQCTLSTWRHVINWRRCDKTQTRATSVCGLESESRIKQDCVFCLMSWRSWCAAALTVRRLCPFGLCWLPTEYTDLYLRSHHCEDLKFNMWCAFLWE
jgi:hypothetical protein